MAILSASFETGTNGNTITTGDLGADTAWDLVTITSPGAFTYDTAHAWGSLAAKVVPSTATAGVFARWSTALGTVTNHYGRIYLYFTANPTDTTHAMIMECRSGASSCGGFNVGSLGKIQIISNTITVASTMTNAITLNQWVRVEYHVTHSLTVGWTEIKLFNDPFSSVATETLTQVASQNTQANATLVDFGIGGASPSGYGTFWMDGIVANKDAYPGPSAAPPQLQPPHLIYLRKNG